MAVSGGDEFEVICTEEAVCEQVVWQVIDVDTNNIGPITEPWETPYMDSAIWNRVPLTFT